MTLEQAIDTALKNNPQIQAQDENVMAMKMEKNVSFSAMLPKVDMSYGYQRLNAAPSIALPSSPFLPSEIPMGTRDNYKFSLSATQTLYAGGALYNAYKISDNTYQSADITRDQTKRDLKRQVIEAYYGLIQARQTLDVAKSSTVSIKSHLDVANAFFKQGMIPKNDLLEAEVRYAQSLQTLLQAENAVRLSEANLNQLLSRDLASPVDIDKEIPMPDMKTSLEESTATANEQRQELKVTQLGIDSANKGITISKAGYLPSLAATGAYTRTGDHPDVDDEAWTIGMGLTWNLFQGGSTCYNVSKATADRNKMNYIYQAQKNMIALEVKNAYLTAQEAKARTAVAEKSIEQAQENLRIQKDRYNLQVATTTDVLDAESLLDQSRMNHITARSDYAKALAALQAAMGTL